MATAHAQRHSLPARLLLASLLAGAMALAGCAPSDQGGSGGRNSDSGAGDGADAAGDAATPDSTHPSDADADSSGRTDADADSTHPSDADADSTHPSDADADSSGRTDAQPDDTSGDGRDATGDAGEEASGDTANGEEPDAGDDSTGPPQAGCPPLPPSSGRQVPIAGGDVAALVAAVDNAQPGDVILVGDGTFEMGGAYLWIDVPGVTLRSQSGNREAVVLDGQYQTGEVVSIAASDVTVADLTIRRAYNHAVHVVGADPNTGTQLYNLHVIDPGQQGIKINQTGETYADDGLIACSHVELTDAGRSQIRDNCYTGGIDAHRTRGWHVRDNLIEGFWCPSGLSEHGIHFWDYNADTLIERNVVRNCARGIGLGLQDSGTPPRTFPDIDCPTDVFVEDFRGTVRNNMVFADDPDLFASDSGMDTGIAVASACQAKVLHNTVYSTAAPFSSIEWRFAGTSVLVANNLVSHNLRERTADVATLMGNIDGATGAYFADAAAGDLHLSQDSPARDAGSALAPGLCDEDIDGDSRDTSTPDVGADEYRP